MSKSNKELRIRAKLNRLLNELGLDWGILTCAQKGEAIWSVQLSDEHDAKFVDKLHRKFWEGCPSLPSKTTVSIIENDDEKPKCASMKPCRNCGSIDTHVVSQEFFRGQCNDCGELGPVSKTEKEAIENWDWST